MRCVPKLDEEHVKRMEDVLDILAKPANEREPVVALDERPVQLLDSARPGMPMAPRRIARSDYEYVRHGTANIFCIVAPKVGGYLTHATLRAAQPGAFAERRPRRKSAEHREEDPGELARQRHCRLGEMTTGSGRKRTAAPPRHRARARGGRGRGR